jgi:hypothetical protein
MSYRNPGRTPIEDFSAGVSSFQASFDKYAGKVKEIKDLQAKEQQEIDDANAAFAAGKNSVIESAYKISQSMGNATRGLVEGIINDIPSGGFASLSGAEKENVFSQLRLIKQASEGLNYDADNPGNSRELIDVFNKLRNQEIDWEADVKNKTLKLGGYSIGQLQSMINAAGQFKEDESLETDTLLSMRNFVQQGIKNQSANGDPITDDFINGLTERAAKLYVKPDNPSWSYVWQNSMRQNDKRIQGFDAYDYRYNEYDIDDADTRDAFRLNRNLIIENYMVEQLKNEPGLYNYFKEKPKAVSTASGKMTAGERKSAELTEEAQQIIDEILKRDPETGLQTPVISELERYFEPTGGQVTFLQKERAGEPADKRIIQIALPPEKEGEAPAVFKFDLNRKEAVLQLADLIAEARYSGKDLQKVQRTFKDYVEQRRKGRMTPADYLKLYSQQSK